MLHRARLSLAVAMAIAAESYGNSTPIETMTVEATKIPTAAADVAGAITVIRLLHPLSVDFIQASC